MLTRQVLWLNVVSVGQDETHAAQAFVHQSLGLGRQRGPCASGYDVQAADKTWLYESELSDEASWTSWIRFLLSLTLIHLVWSELRPVSLMCKHTAASLFTAQKYRVKTTLLSSLLI